MSHDAPLQLLVFSVGTERFALALSLVDEVVEMPPVQRMPDSPRGVVGVASLRGALVTVYEAGAMLNVPAVLRGVALLFTHAGRPVALVVDDISDAITVRASDVRPAPGPVSDGILIGVIRRGDGLIALVDGNALVDAAVLVSEGEHA